MALSHYVTYASGVTGTQPSINMDPAIAPFNASVAAYVVSTGTYGVQYSMDPVTATDAASRWFDDANLPAGTTTSKATNYMFPITKIRIVIVANATGIEFKTLQGFTTN